MRKPLNIGLVLFENLTQLDLTGPYEVLSQLPGAAVDLTAADLQPVRDGKGLAIVPTQTFL